MSKFIVAALAAIVAGGALWGWGWAVRRCARTLPLPHALTMAVGLAAVLFLGGILNLLRLAQPVALDAIVLVGLALAVAGWLVAGRPGPGRPTRAAIMAGIPVLITGWFVAAYLLPQSVFNVHDDLEKYLAYPVKMLATGTLQPNPLGAMGGDSLGGQAFLQAIVLAHFPLPFIGAADNFFCLLLCVTLAGFAVKPGGWALGALAAELSVLAINPQLVNLSAVFSGAALLMAAVFLTGLPAADGRTEPSSLLLGLLYAGTLALKTTFVPLIGLHFVTTVAVGLWLGQLRWRWSLGVAGWSAVFVAPWVILHLPLYLSTRKLAPHAPPDAVSEPLKFFSSEPMVYGATKLHYTSMALVALVVAAFILFTARRGWLRVSLPLSAAAAAGLAAGLAYVAFVAILGPLYLGQLAATRYACPMFIAVIPALLRLIEPLETDRRRSNRHSIGAAALLLAVVVAFLPSATARISSIAQTGVPLAFFAGHARQERDDFIAYNHEVLFGSVESKIASLQALVPAGEPLGVWVMAPFWLDFKRNPITHVDPAGLGMHWSQLPAGLDYFILEYNGYAVRSIKENTAQLSADALIDRLAASDSLSFLLELNQRAGKGKMIYNDGSYVLIRFARPQADSP